MEQKKMKWRFPIPVNIMKGGFPIPVNTDVT